MQALDALVKANKVLYLGISDTPGAYQEGRAIIIGTP